jgi:hypothetical protein
MISTGGGIVHAQHVGLVPIFIKRDDATAWVLLAWR